MPSGTSLGDILHLTRISSATAQGNANGSSWKHTSYARHPRERRRLSRWLQRQVRRFHLCSGEKHADSDRATHGSLSSVHIATSGGKVLGSSSDATVTSIHSELTSSWINRGVPQQEANERNRSAYETLRSSPLRTSIALLGTLHQVTYGAALARRQSSQWQSLPCFGLTCRR